MRLFWSSMILLSLISCGKNKDNKVNQINNQTGDEENYTSDDSRLSQISNELKAYGINIVAYPILDKYNHGIDRSAKRFGIEMEKKFWWAFSCRSGYPKREKAQENWEKNCQPDQFLLPSERYCERFSSVEVYKASAEGSYTQKQKDEIEDLIYEYKNLAQNYHSNYSGNENIHCVDAEVVLAKSVALSSLNLNGNSSSKVVSKTIGESLPCTSSCSKKIVKVEKKPEVVTCSKCAPTPAICPKPDQVVKPVVPAPNDKPDAGKSKKKKKKKSKKTKK